MAIARGRKVKNLGWLLRNWKEVERFTVTKKGDVVGGSHADDRAYLIAHLRDGETFETHFASANVLYDWINRPVFKTIPIRGLGENAEVGRGSGWTAIHEKLHKRSERQSAGWKEAWEGSPTFKVGHYGFEVRHDIGRGPHGTRFGGRDKWYVLRDGSQQTNEAFESREAAHRWIKAKETELKRMVHSAKIDAAANEQSFKRNVHEHNWKLAYLNLDAIARAASHMEVYGDKRQIDAKNWDRIYKELYALLAKQAREHGHMTLADWHRAGFSHGAARHESGANPRVHSKRRSSSAARGNVLVDTSLKKRMNAVLGKRSK